MENINITAEQRNMLIGGCCDCMLVDEYDNLRLIAMVDGDRDFMFINYEVGLWGDNTPMDNGSQLQYFNEDFDSAEEEFRFQALIQYGRMTDRF
tara:strand:+ start:1995 stop:2276 length:282 start_codon:yes stop_codon:yes gene_type:complete